MNNPEQPQKQLTFNPEHQSIVLGIKHAALSPSVHASLFLGQILLSTKVRIYSGLFDLSQPEISKSDSELD